MSFIPKKIYPICRKYLDKYSIYEEIKEDLNAIYSRKDIIDTPIKNRKKKEENIKEPEKNTLEDWFPSIDECEEDNEGNSWLPDEFNESL